MHNLLESKPNVLASFSIFLFLMVLLIPSSNAQSNQSQISVLRDASNDALKSYDNDKVLSFLTEDVLITTGNGTLLAGKKKLKRYISNAENSKMYWVRTTVDIIVNMETELAWETGTWKGFDPEKGEDSTVGGKYSAMWTKDSGEWLIKSQLFVTLE